jgi:signal transduction histidine kinase
MKLRLLLGILFTLWLLLASFFIGGAAFVLVQQIAVTLPILIMVGNVQEPFLEFLIQVVGLLGLFLVLLISFLYLLLDRLIVRPVKAISFALQYFAEHSAQAPLPQFSQSITEIHSLTDSFVKFTDTVEQVHKRDMEISRVKSDFISTAAHQLRTPLTGIRWALEALQKEQLTEDQRGLVQNAVDKSHDLVGVVGTLLDISSIESGKYKYAFKQDDIDQVVAEVSRDLSPLAQKSNVTLFYARTETPPPLVVMDRERIKWILNNLVENAIRYTPEQGSVRLTIDSNNGFIYVRVRDTGIGIPVQDRNNIFERFFRAGNAIAKENQGNGLGLYIARTIATDHHGDLTFEENKEGIGTTFVLSIPLTPPQA